jgi:hypothetical protein
MEIVVLATMKNGDKFQSSVKAESVEAVEAELTGKPFIKLNWEKSMVLIAASDISTLFIGEQLPPEEVAPILD